MNSIPFPAPKTPDAYKYLRPIDPDSPLARYSQPLPDKLPSLQSWKDTCRDYSISSSSFTSSTHSSQKSTFTEEYIQSLRDINPNISNIIPSEDSGMPDSMLGITRNRERAFSNTSRKFSSMIRKQFRKVMAKSGISKRSKRKSLSKY
ncbi:hypothetical protein ABKN59_004907 [Abortiporus biennis]